MPMTDPLLDRAAWSCRIHAGNEIDAAIGSLIKVLPPLAELDRTLAAREVPK